jgi:hypothetical protein
VKNKKKGKNSIVSLNFEVDYCQANYKRSINTYAKFLFRNFFSAKRIFTLT